LRMNYQPSFQRPHWQLFPVEGQVGRILAPVVQNRGKKAGGAFLGIVLVICASSLGGCVTSSDEVGTNGIAAESGAFASANVAGAGRGTARSASAARNSGYTVGPSDVLEISVFKVPELSKSVQVADTGTINMPLLGEVPAAGKTAQEIEQDLTRKLGAKYLKSPQVTVFVKDHNSQRVTVEGAVRKPGVYPIKGKLSLVQALATAEGVDKDLYSKDVTVFRMVDGVRTSRVFDIDAIRGGKAEDPALEQGDVVVVEVDKIKEGVQTALRIIPGVAAAAVTHVP
jgi:polysaccharide biosynthesis/export protein